MTDTRQVFAQEAEELLQEMEDSLLGLEDDPDNEEILNALFRAMHTIKGSAGIFGFNQIVVFTHPVETVLDEVRKGQRELTTDLVAILLDCKDHTAKLVEFVLAADDESAVDPELQAAGESILTRLTGKELQPSGANTSVNEDDDSSSKQLTEPGSRDYWLISLQFKADALRNGLDPLSFLRYLKTLGEIVEIFTLDDGIPDGQKMDPESCYLGFRIVFNSDSSKEDIENVFEFARDDCDIRILPPQSRLDHYLQILEELPEDHVEPLGEILVKIGALTRSELDQGLEDQGSQKGQQEQAEQPGKPLGQILVDRQVVSKPVVEQALKKQEKVKQKVVQESKFIRVDSDKLGQLINLVGELVISSAAMKLLVSRHELQDVEEVVSGVEHLVEEIRDNALQLRMVQIGETFSRFRRVVRDVSKELGKDIELQITGAETELDKTVIEKINDPLTHLIRNSLDHGIESPEERIANGKPGKGTVHLNAYHDSGHIVIQISDDGAGLDAERIREKAVTNGLIKPEQQLDQQSIYRLIFEPGLSTKQQANNLSGRGVGMDVVRRNIEALRGNIDLDSEHGKGTTVTIHLPLTLAIIDGFMVGSRGEFYVIPLSMVEECVEMDSGDWQVDDMRHYVNLRGNVLPYLRLADFFKVGDKGVISKHRESLVVVRFGRTRAGLVVDELFGELQTVIKPMGKVFSGLKGISGATVLGSGEIALILDVQGLIGIADSYAGVSGTEQFGHA